MHDDTVFIHCILIFILYFLMHNEEIKTERMIMREQFHNYFIFMST